jgi:hypothetical protein
MFRGWFQQSKWGMGLRVYYRRAEFCYDFSFVGKRLNAKDIFKEIFNIRKSQVMPDQMRKWLR